MRLVSRRLLSPLLALLVAAGMAVPGPAASEPRVPGALEPWIPWVLHGEDPRGCPWDGAVSSEPADGAGQVAPNRLCAWPGRLYLDLGESSGLFAQRWEVFADSWVPLPGDADHWPQDTRRDDLPIPVVPRDGVPSVKLGPGVHAISGRFVWPHPPDGLTLAPQTGLLSLVIDGEAVPRPRLEPGGRLWIGAATTAVEPKDEDRISIEVFRKIDDDLPLRVTTRLELEISGQARLLSLAPTLLPGGVPLAVESPLPARLDADGLLQLQVRPGTWAVEIESYHPGDVTALRRAEAGPAWPEVEVWSFAAQPDLRRVELQGLAAVDPGQVGVPDGWSGLPAYRAGAADTLALEVRGRGDPDPGPSRLDLTRHLWLDFDGAGYSARDRISGQLTQGWRLDLRSPLRLGQVQVDGQPRLITRLTDDDPPGVEVRRGRLALVADSRLDAQSGLGGTELPISGWNLELGSVGARLHLPPGWDLLAVSGVDNVPASWISRWTLLDLFLVLILALGVARLWGAGWGALALAAMALTWQVPGAPRLIWLILLAAVALLRLLPPNPQGRAMARVRSLVQWVLRLGLLALLVVGLPFVAGQVRDGIWPQLQRPWLALGGDPGAATHSDFDISALQRDEYAVGIVAGEAIDKGIRNKLAAPPFEPAPPPLDIIDPGARVQSGPGMPDWDWNSFQLNRSGPVQPDERVHLWLLSPFWHLLWSLAGAILVVILGLRIAGLIGGDRPGAHQAGASSDGMADASPDASDRLRPDHAARAWTVLILLPLLAGLGAGLATPDARAEVMPTPELLDQLETRLLEPPDCLPGCADLSSLTLEADPGRMRLVLTLDVAAHVAIPVPGGAGGWIPTELGLNGEALDAIRRDTGDRLLLALRPGRHQVELAGPLPERTQVEIPLPMPPRRLIVEVTGWTLEGLDATGRPGGQLRLMRQSTREHGDPTGDAAALAQGALPPLLSVERLLRLGIDWRIETQVRRLSPAEHPAALPVPLLPGESVQTPGAQVSDGQILVNLAPGVTETRWDSTLQPVGALALTAAEHPSIVETWSLDLSPRWHLAWEGIAPVQQVSASEVWLPSWRPLPGERLTLAITRPAAVPGPTLTLDQVNLQVRPGRRASESELGLTLRGTQGGTHAIRLPEAAVPVQVQFDGREQVLPAAGSPVEVSLVPGTQRVRVLWRESDPLGPVLRPRGPDLGSPAVNLRVSVSMPQDRWILFAQGPSMGPVVLFWGVLLVLAGLALALGRVRLTPLRAHDWFLLGIGLALAEIWVTLLVAGWLFALGLRRRLEAQGPEWRYNLVQIGLIVLSLAALAGLVTAVSQGLLGRPEMQIVGNGSHAGLLQWYQDRGGPGLPEVSVVSVPLWVYRALMLAWALWLALRLLDWLRWGWEGFSRPVLWMEGKHDGPRAPRRKTPAPTA